MPIHDVGYRNWKGKLTALWTRWWVIGEVGILTALKSRWIRNMLIASWIPVLYLGVLVFVFENTMATPKMDLREIQARRYSPDEVTKQIEGEARRYQFRNWVVGAPNSAGLVDAFESGDDRIIRNRVWCWTFMYFLRYPQGVMTLLIVGVVVPPLIARDVRSRAFLLYYSRPISRFDYIMGKLSVPIVLLAMITFVPAMGMYCFGVMMSPNLDVLWDTWDIPFRILIAAMVCIVPTCLLAMLFSALTEESRFAGFAWLASWGLGFVVWSVIYLALLLQAEPPPDGVASQPIESNWSLVSLYSTIGTVQAWVLGQEPDFGKVAPSLAMLFALSTVCAIWLYRRVSAPIRI